MGITRKHWLLIVLRQANRKNRKPAGVDSAGFLTWLEIAEKREQGMDKNIKIFQRPTNSQSKTESEKRISACLNEMDYWIAEAGWATRIKATNKLNEFSENAQEQIDFMLAMNINLVVWENIIVVDRLGKYTEYKKSFRLIADALGDVPGVKLLKRFEAIMNRQVRFYDPYRAFFDGHEHKKAIMIGQEEGFSAHLSAIENAPEYLANEKAYQEQFDKLMELLKTEEWRLALCRLTQLHGDIYGIIKKKLQMFYDMGFESAITIEEHGFMKTIESGFSFLVEGNEQK